MCSLVYGIVRTARNENKPQLVFDAVWITIVIGYLIYEWPSVSRSFRFRIPKRRTFLELLAATVCVFLFLKVYFAVFALFDWPAVHIVERFTQAHWPLWSIFAVESIEPGLIEEVAFRGILQTKLTEILSAREALIIQAALFSVLHLSPAIFVSHFVMGLLLGWVRLRTGHLYFGMVLHMAWNATVILKELG